MAKKRHLGLWITLGVVFTLVIAPVATFYICFFDSTTASFEGKDNVDQKHVFTNLAVDSLDEAKTNHLISYQITQDTLNQLLYTAAKTFPEDAKNHLKKLTVEIDQDTYHFLFDMTFPIFQSRLDISCGVAEQKDAGNPDNDAFVFTIKDVKLGRIWGLQNLATSIAGNFIKDQDLNKSFQDAGLNMTVSLSQKTITYNKKQALADLQTILNPSNETGLYFTILQDFLSSDLLTFDFYKDARISGNVDLTSLHTNETYCTPDKELGIDIGPYRDKLKTLLDHKIIGTEENEEANAFDYLIRGYANASTEAKAYMAGKDLTSISVSDYTTYTGSSLHYAKSIDDSVKEQINIPDIALGKVAKLGENEINDVIKTTEVFGYSYLLTSEEEELYKVNYITVDNFYCNIIDGHLYLVVGVSINGYETSVILDSVPSAMNQYSLELRTDKVFYGTHEASANLKNLFFSLVSRSVESEGWMSFDKTNGNIVIDLSSSIAASGLKTIIDARGHVNVALKGTSLTDQGYFDITVG